MNANETDPSFAFLVSSVGKDYFKFKMKLEPLINHPQTSIYNQDNFEFLCDLIQKQHLYINELESKTKTLKAEIIKLKETIKNKEKMLKSFNENVISDFMKSNYEQEQTINMLQQEVENLKSNWKLKGNYNTNSTVSNFGLSALTTAREDNKSLGSTRESKDEKSIRKLLYKNDNDNQIKTKQNTEMQSNQSRKIKKGINVYLHKEKLKLISKSRNNNKKVKSKFSNQYLQTSVKCSENESRNNSCNNNNKKGKVVNTNNSIDSSLIKAKINKMKLSLDNEFGSFTEFSKRKKMKKYSSLY